MLIYTLITSTSVRKGKIFWYYLGCSFLVYFLVYYFTTTQTKRLWIWRHLGPAWFFEAEQASRRGAMVCTCCMQNVLKNNNQLFQLFQRLLGTLLLLCLQQFQHHPIILRQLVPWRYRLGLFLMGILLMFHHLRRWS